MWLICTKNLGPFMLNLKTTNRFDKDYVRQVKRGKDLKNMDRIIDSILNGKPLEIKHRDHPLKGDYVGHRECHIEPDWLLIYKKTEEDLILVRTGTHSDLF